MKKFIAVILALALAASFAACGGRNHFKADIFINNMADDKTVALLDLIKARLETAGLTETEYEVHDAGGDQATQLNQISDACKAGSKLLVVALVAPAASDVVYSVIQLAKNNQVPVMFYDREPTEAAAVNSYSGEAIYVGPNSADAALVQAQLIFDFLKDNFNRYDRDKDGNITYVQLVTSATTLESSGRLKVADEVNRLLKDAKLGQLVYYDAESTTLYDSLQRGLRTEAARAMDEVLKTAPLSGRHPLELVIATTDAMALGAIDKLNELGYNQGADSPMIPVFGIDDAPEARDALNSGALSGTVRRDIEALAQRVVDIILLVKNGASVSDVLVTYEIADEDQPYYIRTPYVKAISG